MRVDQCEVWITCEGQRLPEYRSRLAPAARDDGKVFECFIPSEPGKSFAVEWRNTSVDYLTFVVKLDGTNAGTTPCPSHEEGALRRIRTSSTTKQPFQFSELVITDADDALHVPANADLGTIHVKVQQVQPIPKTDVHPRSSSYRKVFHSIRPVHERSKKAGVHCITLGETIETTPHVPSKWTFKAIEPDRGPVVKFLFRCRSLAHLQAQGIVPLPTQSLEPSLPSQTEEGSQADDARRIKRRRVGTADANTDEEVDVKPAIEGLSDDDEDELSVLKGQLSQIMDRITRMEQKKRRKDVIPRKAVILKEELLASASSSQLGMGSGDVIDLTLSD